MVVLPARDERLCVRRAHGDLEVGGGRSGDAGLERAEDSIILRGEGAQSGGKSGKTLGGRLWLGAARTGSSTWVLDEVEQRVRWLEQGDT